MSNEKIAIIHAILTESWKLYCINRRKEEKFDTQKARKSWISRKSLRTRINVVLVVERRIHGRVKM